ncbi:MAG TPA: hypothetical protein VK908_10355 [Jiangellales bacterium]|nr:hypothetical protein [Jiangellales bacterium]
MTRSALILRCSTVLAAAALVAGLGATAATARVDPGADTGTRSAASASCSTYTVAGHLARCDYLTGGVAHR